MTDGLASCPGGQAWGAAVSSASMVGPSRARGLKSLQQRRRRLLGVLELCQLDALEACQPLCGPAVHGTGHDAPSLGPSDACLADDLAGGVPGKDGLDGGRELGTSPEATGRRIGIGSNTAHAGKMMRPGRWRQEQGCGGTTCRPA